MEEDKNGTEAVPATTSLNPATPKTVARAILIYGCLPVLPETTLLQLILLIRTMVLHT